MGKALRIQSLKLLVLFLVLSCAHTFNSFGQVPLVDLRSFEISFAPEESSRERSSVHLSVQEARRMSGLEVNNEEGPLAEFTEDKSQQTGFFYITTQGGTSIGRYYHQNDDNILSQLPIRNGTPSNISGISLAFDFVFLPAADNSDVTFQLSYRVNNGNWKSPEGGFFTSEMLQQEKQGWSTFSMQIFLDQLYILPNDQLEIRWTALDDDASDFLPIALQKVELFADEAAPRKLHPGSLIISEIMTSFDTGSGFLEYVEVFNSTEEPLNLKGLVLQSGRNRVVVQQNLIAPPYEAVVLAGYSRGNDLFKSIADYHYPEGLLNETSERLRLVLDGVDVARALYESQNKGTSIQINHLENAFDGYSGLSNFIPATDQYKSVFTGTPGRVEYERRLYSKTISSNGWYLLTPPGSISEATNREVIREMKPIMLSNQTNAESGLNSPYIYHQSEGAEPVRFYASGSNALDTGSETSGSVNAEESDLNSLTNLLIRRQSSITEMTNPEGHQAYPALLTWNASSQAFEFVWQENDRIEPWNSYLVSTDVSADQMEENDQSKIDPELNSLSRLINISLKSDAETDSETVLYDQSMIGFWEPVSLNRAASDFNLPKFWTPISEESGQTRQPLIYLKSANGGAPASYLNFPHSPEENIRIPVGLKFPASIDRATFSWDFIETLPDQWEIEFVDTEFGKSINMRHEQNYSFTERSDIVSEGIRDPEHSFHLIKPDEYSRFYINISPSGDLGAGEEETETPDSIELKQNYPNPFNPMTTIGFYLPVDTDVRIGVYNVVGQQVGMLVDDRLNAGNHTVTWNALDMPSGVYIVQLEAMNTVQTRKITLVK